MDCCLVSIACESSLLLANNCLIDSLLWLLNGHTMNYPMRILFRAMFMAPINGGLADTSALAFAAHEKQIEAMKLLIENGADVSTSRPMSHAAMVGSVEAMKLLLDAKADVDVIKYDHTKMTPLIRCAALGHNDAIQFLIDAKASLEARDHKNRTALLFAAEKNETNAMKVLIAAKADVHVVNNHFKKRQRPLFFAVENNNLVAVQMLLDARAQVDARLSDGDTALSLAAKKGNIELLKILIVGKADVDLPNDAGQTPLMIAVAAGHSSSVTAILEEASSQRVADKKEQVAETTAVNRGAFSSFLASSIKKMSIDAQK